MTSRPLTPNERMTDAFDRASTMNFTTVAHLRGPLDEAALRVALDRLGQRHPLLRARIERAGKRSRFVAGAAAPLALVVKRGAQHEVLALAEQTLVAREITSSVQREKKSGSPLLTAPIAGPFLTDRFANAPPSKLRELAENKLMHNTFSLTNLGRLEQLEVHASIGPLTLDDLYFVAAGSVLVALEASATSYRDELSYQLVGTSPRVTAAQVSTMTARIESQLLEYARVQA